MSWKIIINKWDLKHQLYKKNFLNKIYKIENIYCLQKSQESYIMNRNTIPYSNWKFLGFIEWLEIYTKQKNFNLQNPLEKELARIYSFYEVLNGVENPLWEILYWTLNSEEKLFDYMWWWEWEHIINNYDSYIWEDWMEKCFPSKKWIWIWCDEENNIPYTEFYLTYKEFYLLMEIYFWLYIEEEPKKQLEEKEKNWEYEEIKKILTNDGWMNIYKGIDWYRNFVKDYLSQPKVQEYLKLELMRKETTWVFEGLKIEKIYDKNCSEEKQKKCIDEVNREFWEEVLVEE